MDFTTAARVKAAGQGFSGSTQDSLLGALITNCSAAAEKYVDRGLAYTTSRVEYFNVDAGQTVLRLHAFPAIANLAVFQDTAHASSTYTPFAAATEVNGGSFAVDEARGLLIFDDGILLGGARSVKVSYDGGIATLATSASNFIGLFPDIAQAVEMWVLYLLNQFKNPGYTSISMDGVVSSVSSFEMPLLSRNVLDRYRRPAVGL